MNQTKWTQLRGYINLKTALALGAISLVGAFVVRLPAQNQNGCATCGVGAKAIEEGTSQITAQYPESVWPSDPFATGSFVPEQSRGAARHPFASRR